MMRAVIALSLVILAAMPFFAHPGAAEGATAAEVQAQIDARNAQIKQLEEDIAAYQRELDQLGAKKSTLKTTLSGLSVTAKQLASKIEVTKNKISAASVQIAQLTDSIGDKEVIITADRGAIAKTLRQTAEREETPLIAALLSSETLGDAWRMADASVQFNRALAADITELQDVRIALAADRDAVSSRKNELVSLTDDLSTEKRSVDANAATQKKLIAETSNQETSYQKLIAEKKAAEKAFEDELVALQSQLDLIVHPGSLPKVGSGVLSWPFSSAFMGSCAGRGSYFGNTFCITQFFGNTSFSTANPQIYNGKGHNAIDIAAPIGTPVLAAAGGTVLATGNTDLVRGCYSFGKWVMVTHGNGLNTLYSHLSEIDVAQGQGVASGQRVGLSGMTGYATGPHLHFGVYASEGTQIMTLGQFRLSTKTPCKNATMPVATLDAYLNPLSYL